jgi:hypothetical protein
VEENKARENYRAFAVSGVKHGYSVMSALFTLNGGGDKMDEKPFNSRMTVQSHDH